MLLTVLSVQLDTVCKTFSLRLVSHKYTYYRVPYKVCVSTGVASQTELRESHFRLQRKTTAMC